MHPEPLPARVLWEGDVDNAELVRVVAETARACAPLLQWDRRIPRAELAFLCWSYVRECTLYTKEEGVQRVRAPWAFVADREGDCKSTAVFIGCMCKAAGLNVKLRFANMPSDEHWSHVYAMIDGVAVDPLMMYGAECLALRYLDVPL